MKEFLTYKSGKFYFCEEYDVTQIEKLLVRANVLNETIIDLPILPNLASKIEPEIMYSSISGTAAIEGNSITVEDVEKIAKGEKVEKYTQKDQQEIKNLIKAYNYLSNIKASEKPYIITEDIICSIHQIITADVFDEKNIPGKYRNGLVYVGDNAHGGIYTPPTIIEDIQNLMNVFIEWINSDTVLNIDPFVRAFLAHYYFCIIHPFWDGNGRTGRLIEAVLLQAANIKYVPRELSNYYYKNVDEYYNSFSKSLKLKKDVTPFIKFCLEASIESLTGIKKGIILFIRKFTLRDYYIYLRNKKKLTERQFSLLNLLLDTPIAFSMKDLQYTQPLSLLYGKASTQTARRDLKKMLTIGLLLMDKDNKFYLNVRALD